MCSRLGPPVLELLTLGLELRCTLRQLLLEIAISPTGALELLMHRRHTLIAPVPEGVLHYYA